MKTQPQAQIYLADQRGYSETDSFRSHHTFNAGHYQLESRHPFGFLYRFDEVVLAPGASLSVLADADAAIMLLPVSGGMANNLNEQAGLAMDFLVPGQVRVSGRPAGLRYTISNPYETEYITFLHIGQQIPAGNFPVPSGDVSFDLAQKNQLLPLWSGAINKTGSCGFIGQYDGRQEGIYRLKHVLPDTSKAGLFLFVLRGVFEVANRLLHEKDSLALWHLADDTVEFEALSNDAILILIDLSAPA